MIFNIKKDKKIEELLKDKRIAFVGPSNHLEGKKIGKLIDEYDLICRVNEIFPKDLGEDYGSRTDISFINFATREITHFIYKIRESGEKAKNIKQFICPVIKAQHDWGGSVRDNEKIINIYNTPTYFIDKEDYETLYNQVGIEPNMGFLSILFLLQYSIKELFVTGISFYAQLRGNTTVKDYDIYYHKGYTPKLFQYSEWSPDLCHQIDPQLQYFKKNILTNYRDIVKIDSYLNDLLKINYHNVVEL